MKKAYIAYLGGGRIKYKKLNPTGRWKEVAREWGDREMYIEHRYCFFFKTWVSEVRIEFADEQRVQIFECKK